MAEKKNGGKKKSNISPNGYSVYPFDPIKAATVSMPNILTEELFRSIWDYLGIVFSYFSICFYRELEKIIPELSSNIPP